MPLTKAMTDSNAYSSPIDTPCVRILRIFRIRRKSLQKFLDCSGEKHTPDVEQDNMISNDCDISEGMTRKYDYALRRHRLDLPQQFRTLMGV